MNRSLRSLARRLCIGFHRPPDGTAFWSGAALDLDILDEAPNPSGLLAHEIAHNLLARPHRHRAPNYGFGGNARDGSNAPILIRGRAAQDEEDHASLVGNIILSQHAPALLAESLEETYFVEQVRGRWCVGLGSRQILTRAMRCGILATVPIPQLSNPFALVDFLCGAGEALLEPLSRRLA